ncbi:MAG: nucleotidyltransferase family protein [Solirubrobacterales bacterium]
MKDWRKARIYKDTPIIEAIRSIDTSAIQIGLVIDDNNTLLGTITDGDIRRAILRGLSLDEPVMAIMNRNPIVAHLTDGREVILETMRKWSLHHIPIVNEANQLIGIETIDAIIRPDAQPNPVVLMAGGIGSRLWPLTEECPKPLLKIGGKPILEIILDNFIEYGFNHFYFSVNYKAEMIESYFGDGSKWGVDIRYLKETAKMGTAGALGMLRDQYKPNLPVIVMNGDLLTKLNLKYLMSFHNESAAAATMCVREYSFQVPFGVVRMNGHELLGIDEKPTQSHFVNAGIYVLEPEVLELVPENEPTDMPHLFNGLLQTGKTVTVFPIREYWMDIGRLADFERANVEFPDVFK